MLKGWRGSYKKNIGKFCETRVFHFTTFEFRKIQEGAFLILFYLVSLLQLEPGPGARILPDYPLRHSIQFQKGATKFHPFGGKGEKATLFFEGRSKKLQVEVDLKVQFTKS